jgi:hypothetical protein
MASYLVRIERLEDLFNDWVAHMTTLLGQPSQWLDMGVVTIEWPALFVPNPLPPGETPETTKRNGRVTPREKPFFRYRQGMWESLRGNEWNRIQWFYYCDDFQGNTVRLYDMEHFGVPGNQYLYLETDLVGHDVQFADRVLLRGEWIGKADQSLKLYFRNTFSQPVWGAKSAPIDQQRRPSRSEKVDVMGMCDQFFDKRHAYFQRASHNNMPNNTTHVTCNPTCHPRTCCVSGTI